MSTETKAVVLIQRVIEKCYKGTIPADTTRLVAACIMVFLPEGTQPEVTNQFALHLVQAIDCLRRVQNARWEN